MLVNMPVSTEPVVVFEFPLDLLQPFLGRVVHGTLVDHRKKGLARLIRIGAGVGEDGIYLPPAGVQRLDHLVLGLLGRLLFRPPAVTSGQPVEFVSAVSYADDQMSETFQIKDLTIHSKQQAGKGFLYPDCPAVPLLRAIGRDAGRPDLMVAVDAEHRRLYGGKNSLHLCVSPVSVVVRSYISKQNQSILLCQLLAVAKLYDLIGVSVDITRVIDHWSFHLSFLIIPTRKTHIRDFPKTYPLFQKYIHLYWHRSTGSQCS